MYKYLYNYINIQLFFLSRDNVSMIMYNYINICPIVQIFIHLHKNKSIFSKTRNSITFRFTRGNKSVYLAPAVWFLLCTNLMPIVAHDSDFIDSDFCGRSGVGRWMRCLLHVSVQLILIQCYKRRICRRISSEYIFFTLDGVSNVKK